MLSFPFKTGFCLECRVRYAYFHKACWSGSFPEIMPPPPQYKRSFSPSTLCLFFFNRAALLNPAPRRWYFGPHPCKDRVGSQDCVSWWQVCSRLMFPQILVMERFILMRGKVDTPFSKRCLFEKAFHITIGCFSFHWMGWSTHAWLARITRCRNCTSVHGTSRNTCLWDQFSFLSVNDKMFPQTLLTWHSLNIGHILLLSRMYRIYCHEKVMATGVVRSARDRFK